MNRKSSLALDEHAKGEANRNPLAILRNLPVLLIEREDVAEKQGDTLLTLN